ncbi:MAG: hypothetical protein QOG44_1974, partial [Acidimicrobiaceae bacterium]|nr:hypothetical protein [Acidimicrobiaceae bacterium]
ALPRRAVTGPSCLTWETLTVPRPGQPSSISAIVRLVGVSRGTLYAHMDAITAGRSS